MEKKREIEHNIFKEKFLINLAKEYLDNLEVKKEYKCFYINDKFEIQQGYGYIDNNQLYNYHAGLDISDNTLFVKGTEGWNNIPNSKWWSLSLNEAQQKQSQLIKLKVAVLKNKILKIQNSKNIINFL